MPIKWSFSKSSYRDEPPSFYSTSLDGCIPKRILVGFSGLKWKNRDAVPLTEPQNSLGKGIGTRKSKPKEGQVLRLLYKARSL